MPSLTEYKVGGRAVWKDSAAGFAAVLSQPLSRAIFSDFKLIATYSEVTLLW